MQTLESLMENITPERLELGIQVGIICQFCHRMYPRGHSECMTTMTKEEMMKRLSKGDWRSVLVALEPRKELRDHDWEEIYSQRGEKRKLYKSITRHVWMSTYMSWCLFPQIQDMKRLLVYIQGKTILELGSGSGLWAAILRSAGCKVYATDPYESKFYEIAIRFSDDKPKSYQYTDIERCHANEALQKYGEQSDVLFISWGQLGGMYTMNDLQYFTGDVVVIVGEDDGGCTYAGYVESMILKWKLRSRIPIPQWTGIRDDIRVYTRY